MRDVTEGSINVPYLLTYVLKDEYLIGLYEKKLVYTIPDDLTDREYRVSMRMEILESSGIYHRIFWKY